MVALGMQAEGGGKEKYKSVFHRCVELKGNIAAGNLTCQDQGIIGVDDFAGA